jgi:oligosaccharide repeat unit polymerase
VVGALAFSFGGLFVLVVKRAPAAGQSPPVNRRASDWSNMALDVVLIALLIGFPLCWLKVTRGLDFTDPLYFAIQRALAVAAQESSERTFSFIDNLPVVAMFLAIAMHMENDGSFARRWRAYLAIMLALVYGSLTGSKGNAIMLLLSLCFVSLIRARKVNLIKLGGILTLGLLLFSVGLMLVNFAYMGTWFSQEMLGLIFATIQNYWLGGLVAFERIAQDPASIESAHRISRFFLETANGLGASYYVPSIHAEFTSISASQDINTYTIYFSYFKDFGWPGTVIALTMLGAILTWNYQRARRGTPMAIAFYGVFTCAVVLSIHAEHFALALNFYIKMLLFFFVVYQIAPRLAYLFRSSMVRRHA